LIIRRLNEIAAQQKVQTQMLTSILSSMVSADSRPKKLPDGFSLPLNTEAQLRDMELKLTQTSVMELFVS
jgi:hypothetical protein